MGGSFGGGGDPGPILAAMCCVFVVIIPIALAIGATILRAACSFVGVRQPDFMKAMGIVLLVGIVTSIVNFTIQVGMGVLLGASFAARGPGPAPEALKAVQLISTFVCLPVDALITGALYVPLLETTFGKGLLVWLMQFLIGIAIAIAIGIAVVLLVVVVGGAASMR